VSLSRRRFLAVAGASAAGAALTLPACNDVSDAAADDLVDFYGAHQAGIITPAQDHMHFAAFDVTTTSRDDLIGLLQRWTAAAAAMCAGQEVGEFGATDGPLLAPPEDTGEALGLSAGHLTITFGFGPSLFADADGNDRFGLVDRRPRALEPLPHFPGDDLDANRSDGDLCIQACADDPQVAVHAVRNLSRLAFGVAALRWSQLGFGRTSSTSSAQQTPRNLFGFKDGTANVTAEQTEALDEFVWVQPTDDPAAVWLTGGSYLVARRISMHIETWDRTSLQEQEAVFGRDKRNGAPLSGGDEFTAPDFSVAGTGDTPIIPTDAHVRLAHPTTNNGVRILRRGYNFTDGSTDLGYLDAGLFFVAFMRDPVQQFVPLQTNLARHDTLNEYIVHRGSALFAVPAGVTEGSYVGAALFGGVDG
jgi:deferrochelatase/peroxidase EfeB